MNFVPESNVPEAVRGSSVATSGRWEELGVSRKRQQSLVKSGDLVWMRYGVYATRAAVEKAGDNPRLKHALAVRAVTASVGEDAVASHESAAILHGLNLLKPTPDEAARTVTLTRPNARRRNRTAFEGVVFRAASLPPDHVTKWHNVLVTTVARTVADLGRTLPFMDAVVVADSALRDDAVSKVGLERVAASCAGWPGADNARKAIAFATPLSGSVLESCGRVRFAEWGLPAPEPQVTIIAGGTSFTVDFLFREYRTIVEADGRAKYTDKKVLDKQFDRDRLLRDAGYKIVHFTWHELFYSPEVVLDRIRAAFTAPSSF
jgi:Protein of unknown function (DUF559)